MAADAAPPAPTPPLAVDGVARASAQAAPFCHHVIGGVYFCFEHDFINARGAVQYSLIAAMIWESTGAVDAAGARFQTKKTSASHSLSRR